MLATEHFKIKRTKVDDWFDPILNADTELFVDPFLVFREKSGPWSNAHARIIEHFNRAFLLIAQGNRLETSIAYKKALSLLIFSEPRELCLGYTSTGTAGAGAGRGYARTIAAAIADAIGRGLKKPEHFEELGILNEGIGADRISDMTCTVLKPLLVEYTQEIAKRHEIRCDPHSVYAGTFDSQRQRWNTPKLMLPTNPCTGGPLLFVPQRFLRELPVLNADAWWSSYENEQLRDDVNYDVMGKVDKKTIVAAARQNPEAVRKWMKEKEGEAVDSYDFSTDPKGVWQWDRATKTFVAAHAITFDLPNDDDSFLEVIKKVVAQFRLFIQDQGGWELLWNAKPRSEKPESAAQLLFRGIAQHYCQAHNISIDREVELGRGTVDFKFSNGYAHRAHLEVKKLHNGKFWNGLEKQLVLYMKSDSVDDGWLLAIRYRDNKASDARAKQLPDRVHDCATKEALNLYFSLVDAREPITASKL